MSRIPFEELFRPEFLAALQRLSFDARRVSHGGRHADQRSKDLGSGIEFKDFRPYVAGDDFRSIDWTIYRRLGRVFLRLFEEMEDLPVYLLPDLSKSMFLEEPPRVVPTLRCALGLAAIALNHHDRVGVFPFSDDLQIALRPQSGKGRVMRIAREMSKFEEARGTDFTKSLHHFTSLRMRKGLCVILSDFFDPGGLEGIFRAISRLRHRCLLVQVFRRSDREPELRGDLQLRDCESDSAIDVSATKGVISKYEAAYDRFQDSLVDYARKRDIGFLRLDADQPVLGQIATLFESGSLVV